MSDGTPANAIDAPSVQANQDYTLVLRFYAGKTSAYRSLSNPDGHTSLYSLMWTTPNRAANKYQGEGPTGTAQSVVSASDVGLLAAHTVTLNPLPNYIPDFEFPPIVPPGDTDVPPFEPYPIDPINAPNITIDMTGITYDGSDIFAVDTSNSFILRAIATGTGTDTVWTWNVYGYLNAPDDPTFDGTFTEADHGDDGAWQLKDITWDGTHLWVVRGSDQHLLKLGAVTDGKIAIEAEVDLTGTTPTGVGSDSPDLWIMATSEPELQRITDVGVVQETISASWASSGVTGIGNDANTIWLANPSEMSIRQASLLEDEVLRTMGWDPDFESPRSVHRDGNRLFVITSQNLLIFHLDDELVALLATHLKVKDSLGNIVNVPLLLIGESGPYHVIRYHKTTGTLEAINLQDISDSPHL